jgi:hypothetical protein
VGRAVTAPAVVRLDMHKLVFVLYGLCRAGHAPVVFEAHPDAAGVVVVAFEGRHGGHGQLAIADEPGLRATVEWLARHRDGEPYLRAVWAALRACERQGIPFAAERALELLWGPRGPRESRARQAPKVGDLVALLCSATVSLEASVSSSAGKKRDVERERARAVYGGAFSGTLVAIDPATRLVCFDPELRRQLDAPGTPYEMRPVGVFRLRIPGHRNPRGHRPSRAARAATRHGVADYARFRQQQALKRGGTVQAIAVEDLLGGWTSVDVDAVRAGRRMAAFVDVLEEDLATGVLGDVCLPAPVERLRRPGRCELRLRISMARRPEHTNPDGDDGRRRPGSDRRPGTGASATGKPQTTGPPRR